MDQQKNWVRELISCSTEPDDRIGTCPFDTYVTMTSTPGRWSGGRSPLRWLET